MNENLPKNELLRGYLLGELAEDEADRLERRLIEDDEFFDLCEAVEADLIAAYARGELKTDVALHRLVSSPGGRARLALARSLNSVADSRLSESRTVVPFRRRVAAVVRPGAQWALAAAAAILVLIGAFWFTRQTPPESGAQIQEVKNSLPPTSGSEQQPGPSKTKALDTASQTPPDRPVRQDERTSAKTPKRPEPLKAAVFELALTTLRGAERAEVQKFPVPAGTELVEIRLDVEGYEDLEVFHAAVRNQESRETVWEKGGLKPRRLEWGPALVLDIPAGRLPSGRYEVTVTAGTTDVSQQFEVARENR